MATDRNDFNVHHNSQEMRFEIRAGDYLAELFYQLDGEAIIFHHTYVPPELEGQGIGSQLVRAGLEYAKAKSMRVVPLCSFVNSYIQRHDEYQSLVDEIK